MHKTPIHSLSWECCNKTFQCLISSCPNFHCNGKIILIFLPGTRGPRQSGPAHAVTTPQKMCCVAHAQVIYALIFVTGLVGNVATCVVIARNHYMHTTTHLALVRSSATDRSGVVTCTRPPTTASSTSPSQTFSCCCSAYRRRRTPSGPPIRGSSARHSASSGEYNTPLCHQQLTVD